MFLCLNTNRLIASLPETQKDLREKLCGNNSSSLLSLVHAHSLRNPQTTF